MNDLLHRMNDFFLAIYSFYHNFVAYETNI